MMAVIFGAMLVAVAVLWWGRRDWGTAAAVFSLVLAVHLFLWEVYSPETGFRMPWIRTDAGATADVR